MKLFDSELRVMEELWDKGPLTAGEIAATLLEKTGWKRNTTYTVIKKCIAKGAIRREEPKFICVPLITREEAQQAETQDLIGRMFGGSRTKFFAAMLGNDGLSPEEISELKEMIERREKE